VAQDYGKAREWYEKAADKGSEFAMSNIGVLYENGRGVAQDYGKAREWYEKAVEKGDVSANAYLKGLQIKAAFAAGRYADALQLQQAAASEEEAAETERNGKPSGATAAALQRLAWYALFAGEYEKALAVAERSHAGLKPTGRTHFCLLAAHGTLNSLI
jgi:TPR repeat protein